MDRDRWLAFERAHPDVADRLKELIFAACEILQSEKDAASQIARFKSDSVCQQIKAHLWLYRYELGVDSHSDTALTELTLKSCLCMILRAEAS